MGREMGKSHRLEANGHFLPKNKSQEKQRNHKNKQEHTWQGGKSPLRARPPTPTQFSTGMWQRRGTVQVLLAGPGNTLPRHSPLPKTDNTPGSYF